MDSIYIKYLDDPWVDGYNFSRANSKRKITERRKLKYVSGPLAILVLTLLTCSPSSEN